MTTLQFTDDNFQREVLSSDQPVLVDFWAEWCPPCRAIGPTIDSLASEFAGRARVGKLDVDSNPEVASALGVRSIPTLLVFRNGKVIQRFVGVTGRAELSEALDVA